MTTSIGTLRFASAPAMSRKALADRYDREAPHWDCTIEELGFRSQYRELLAAEHFNVCDGQTVQIVDAGCGTGELGLALALTLSYQRSISVETIGIDLSQEMLALASRKFSNDGVRFSSVCGDLEEIPLAGESADFVVSAHAIEHVAHPLKAFAELERILSPGGVLLVMMTRCHPVTLGIQRDWSVQCARSRKLSSVLRDFGLLEIRFPPYPRGVLCNLLSFCCIARKPGEKTR